MALQLRRAKTDWSGFCQMTVQGALWLAKRLSLNLNFSFLHQIRYFSHQVATQLSSRGWVDPVPDPVLPEKFLGYSRVRWIYSHKNHVTHFIGEPAWTWSFEKNCHGTFGAQITCFYKNIFIIITMQSVYQSKSRN